MSEICASRHVSAQGVLKLGPGLQQGNNELGDSHSALDAVEERACQWRARRGSFIEYPARTATTNTPVSMMAGSAGKAMWGSRKEVCPGEGRTMMYTYLMSSW